jgi:RND superfamily putative drug exporter
MEILGKANWWFPTWLQWLPRVDGAHEDPDIADASMTDEAPGATKPVGGKLVR